MSGRIGALNTAGSGWVDPLGVPSCEAMVTVGRVAIVVEMVCRSFVGCAVGFAHIWLWAVLKCASCKRLARI